MDINTAMAYVQTEEEYRSHKTRKHTAQIIAMDTEKPKKRKTKASKAKAKPISEEEIIAFLSQFEKGDRVYPTRLQRECKITFEQACKFMDSLVVKGFVQKKYRIICYNCYIPHKMIYDDLDSIPERFTCKVCNSRPVTKGREHETYQIIKEIR
jgi:predicted transcriptional regulator